MTKAVIQTFEEYQKCRIMFIQTVAELANRPKHIDSLKSVNVMSLLVPLLSDPVTSIKESAALAIGRLAKHSKELAKIVVDDGKILFQLLDSYDSHNVFYKKATCFVISSIARHSRELAKKVAEAQAIKFLVNCLYEYESSVKEAAVWALGYIAYHTEDLAKMIVNENKAIDYLICCLQEPETDIKRNTVHTISQIAKHSTELTEMIITKNNLDYIIYFLKDKDILLRNKICICLANMARNSNVVAKIISEQQLSTISECLRNPDTTIQKSAITLLNEVANKNQEFALQIHDKIGSVPITNFLKANPGQGNLYSFPLISTLCSVKEEITREYIKPGCDLILSLKKALENDAFLVNRNKTEKEILIEMEIKSLACRVIESITKHDTSTSTSPYEHSVADKISEEGIPNVLLFLHALSNSETVLKKSCKLALESIISKIKVLSNLDSLIALYPRLPEYISSSSYNSQRQRVIKKNTFEGIGDIKDLEDLLVKIIKKQQELLLNDQSEMNPTKRAYLKKGNMSIIFKLSKEFHSLKDCISDFETSGIFKPEVLYIFDEDYEKKVKQAFYEGVDK